jgi:MFS family permease
VSFIVLPAALNGLLKELLPEDLLAEANGAMQATRESFRLGGPLLGAILFAWLGAWPVVLIDIVSFLVGAALIAGVRVTEAAPVRRASHLWHELTAGVRSLAQDLVMRHVLVGFVLTLVVIGFAETSLYAVLDAYGKPPTFVAVVSTIQGVGAVAAGLLSSRIIGAIGEVATMVVGFVVLAAGLGVVAATGALWVMLAGCAIIGLALPPLFVGFTTLLQKRTPQEVMGRASMAVEVVMSTPQALSMAIGAALVAIVSYRVIFLIMAVAAVASASYITATLSGQIRADRRAVTAAAAPAPVASRPSAQ